MKEVVKGVVFKRFTDDSYREEGVYKYLVGFVLVTSKPLDLPDDKSEFAFKHGPLYVTSPITDILSDAKWFLPKEGYVFGDLADAVTQLNSIPVTPIKRS